MKKTVKILFVLIAMAVSFGGCLEYEMYDAFEVHEDLMPDHRTDGPQTPSALTASYDEYCDRIVLSWMPTVRTSSYKLYKNGALLAADLADTSYVDMEALTVDTEYWVIAVNTNGESADSAFAIGRMADVPPVPSNFQATDGAFESKVDLTWDAADYAKYYEIARAGVVIADSIVGTSYSDMDAPQQLTEYSITAFSFCGQSGVATAMGRADSLLKYSIILDENFDGLETGFDLSTLEMYLPRFQFSNEGPGTFKVSETDAVSGTKCGEAIYNPEDISTVTSARSIQIVFKDIELLVGQRYRVTFNLKTPASTTLHVAVDSDGSGLPDKTDGLESYLIPSAVNPKNNNIYGVRLNPVPDWTTISYEFPYSGEVDASVYDPDPEALGWTPTTIQEGQEHPKIMIAQWVGKNSFDGVCPPILLDDIKIELIK